MKKIILSIFVLFNFVFAEVVDTHITPKVVDSGIKIVDIRTKTEWKQTGIIKGSKTITFFDKDGRYDVKKFLEALDGYIKPDEKFAIVCRTGHRTKIVSKFLGDNGYSVVNLVGGIYALAKQNYKFVKYEESK